MAAPCSTPTTPSQRNTFTGKLTQEMFDAVFARAREIAAG